MLMIIAGVLLLAGQAALGAPPERADYTWDQIAGLIESQQYEIRLRSGTVSGSGIRLSGGEIGLEVAKEGRRSFSAREVQGVRERRSQRVRLMAGGTRIEGTLLEAQPQSLAVWAEKSSDTARYPRGLLFFPRDQLTAFDLVQEKPGATVVPTLAGVGVGAGIGAVIVQGTPEEGYGIILVPAAAVAVTAGGALTGYAIGRGRGRRIIEVRIVQ